MMKIITEDGIFTNHWRSSAPSTLDVDEASVRHALISELDF